MIRSSNVWSNSENKNILVHDLGISYFCKVLKTVFLQCVGKYAEHFIKQD